MDQKSRQMAPDLIRAWLTVERRQQKWLAEQTLASEEQLSRWLSGQFVPILVYRAKLAEITGLPVADKDAWRKSA